MRNYLERTKYEYKLKRKTAETSPIDLTLDEFFGEPHLSGASVSKKRCARPSVDSGKLSEQASGDRASCHPAGRV